MFFYNEFYQETKRKSPGGVGVGIIDKETKRSKDKGKVLMIIETFVIEKKTIFYDKYKFHQETKRKYPGGGSRNDIIDQESKISIVLH